jgi:Tat protein secretion system quality control protein TatD with DNase activity
MAAVIAEIKGVDVSEVGEVTSDNVYALFCI